MVLKAAKGIVRGTEPTIVMYTLCNTEAESLLRREIRCAQNSNGHIRETETTSGE